MSIEKAQAFVEKFYSDDEFMAEIIKESKMYRLAEKEADKISDEEQYKRIADAATKAGYDVTPEEFHNAQKEYADKLGAWKAMKTAFHMVKIAKKVSKEAAKESK